MEKQRAGEHQNLRAVFPVAVGVVELQEAVGNALGAQELVGRAFVDLGVELATAGDHLQEHLVDAAGRGFHKGNGALLVRFGLLLLPGGGAKGASDFNFASSGKLGPRSLLAEHPKLFVALDLEGEVGGNSLRSDGLGGVVKGLELGIGGEGHDGAPGVI